MKTHLISALVLLALVVPSWCAITATKDSADFTYIVTMDVQPNNEDLDDNGTDDWYDSNVPTVSMGYAVNTADNQLFRGDFTGSLWRAVVTDNTGTVPWTLEVTVGKVGGTQGTNGWFGIATDVEANSSAFYFKDDRVAIENGTTDREFMVGTPFGNGSYHTVRIAHDAVANSYYYWMDGILLNPDLSTPFGPGNPGFLNATSIFIGDYGANFTGTYSIDTIRLTPGAFAPVPEPSTSALLVGLLAVGLARRRR